jgi:hypothetical protein
MRERVKLTAIVVLLASGIAACDKVPLLAPTNSTITLSAATRVVPLNGSTGLTAFVTESSGTPVQNGTTVRFTTTLGSVQPVEAQTVNGLAVATFQAGSSSGVADVRAVSGGATGTGAASTTNLVQITIGAAAITGVVVQASPSSVPASGGSVEIVATATGANNLTLSGVGVTFSSTAGTLSATSGTTDGNGQARVTLTTNRATTVTARVGSFSGNVDVTVSPTASVTLTTAPASPTTGQPVTLTVTPATGTAPNVTIAWGDGASTDMGLVSAARSVTHPYSNSGSYTITATATDSGNTFSTSTTVTVAPLTVSLTVSLATVASVGSTATFTATVTGGSPQTFEWTFGDDSDPVKTTASTASHVYKQNKAYTATVTVTTIDGRTVTGRVEFIVSGI